MRNIPRKSRRRCQLLLAVPALAAVGCSNVSLLGISAEVDGERAASGELTGAPVRVAQALRSATVISGAGQDHPWMRRPSLGDVDGDGVDDFVIEASWSDTSGGYGNRALLFYGRPSFPAQLSTADADAVLETGELPTNALGDINGDGFADFALSDWNDIEFIFGSSTRFEGTHTRLTTGVPWQAAIAGEQLLYPRAVGDIDADGCDELRVTVISEVPVEEASNRGSEIITDYLIAGRREAWPSGSWDPSWAVAMLGDEPPAFEDNGATTVLQRLTVAGTGDLDGDGYTDLLALGRWRMWVFYGSDKGFHGTLTPEQADASLTWPFDPAERRPIFAKTIPFILGDVDGDGTADIGLPNQAELGIVYGTKRRFSGRVQLEPELTVVRATTEMADRNWWVSLKDDISYGMPLPELVSTNIRVGVADLDGDGHPELVLHEARTPAFESTTKVTDVMYTLTGPNKRATGRYVLSDMDIYKANDVSDATAALTTGVLLDPGGDFDGDGSTDLIFGVVEDTAVADSKVSLHLLPGTPHAPD